MKLSIRTYVWLGVIAGVLAILNEVLITQNSLSAGKIVGYVLDIIVAGFTFMVGRRAKQNGKSAVWSGALVGALFGTVAAIGGFFVKITAQGLTDRLAQTHANVDPNTVAMAVAAANSPITHVLGVVGSFVIFGVIGLILGVIGGATTKNVEG